MATFNATVQLLALGAIRHEEYKSGNKILGSKRVNKECGSLFINMSRDLFVPTV